jgi:hypothetical protein
LIDGGYRHASNEAFGEMLRPTLDPRNAIDANKMVDVVGKAIRLPDRYARIEEGLHWLAIAEGLRQRACEAYPLGQAARRHTFLDPETTWTVPASVALPRVPFSLCPLRSVDMAYLRHTTPGVFVNR